VALFGFLLALCNALVGLSMPTVIAKHFFDSEKSQIAELIGNSILVLASFSLAVALLLALTYPYLCAIVPLGFSWVLLVPVTSFMASLFAMGLSVLRNERKGFLFARHQIGNTMLDVSITLMLVVTLVWGWQGRVLGIIASYSISALLMFIYLSGKGYITLTFSREQSKRVLNLVVPLIPHSLQLVVLYQIGLLFMQHSFSKPVMGVYAVALQVAFAIKLLNNALMLSWSPFLYEQLAKKESVSRIYLTRTLLVLLAVMALGVVFIIVFSGPILRIAISRQYHAANKFIPWLAAGYFFNGFYLFLTPILIKFEKHAYLSRISLVFMLVMVVLNLLLIKVFGQLGPAVAFSLIFFLMFASTFWKVNRVFPLPWLQAMKLWA
jgi:O-antigen/teichoic acid export membrane protein